MLEIELNNLSGKRVSGKFLKEVARETLKKAEFNFLKKKIISLSVAIVDEKEMQTLNKKYRQVDAPTDVLSFAEFEKISEIKKEKQKEIFLGEIILCYNDIAGYCQKNRIKIKKELANVFSHGILHLLGFNHGKKMFALQKEVYEKFQ